jgi:hypothetical protein
VTVLPLYAFVQGDTMGVVVLGRLDGTVADLAANMLRAAAVRVKDRGPFSVMAGERRLELDATLETVGMRLLDRVDLVWDQERER